tara:strand:+ start:3672 stop:4637 length:966 start_codon:yes stop_codon:yes gene_type:complete
MNVTNQLIIDPINIEITNLQEERKLKKKKKQLKKKDRKSLLSDKEQKQLKNIDISLKKRLDKDIHKKNIIKFHKEKEQISDVKYGEIYIKNDDSYSKRIALLEMLKEQKKLKEIEEIKRYNYAKICKNRMIRKQNIAIECLKYWRIYKFRKFNLLRKGFNVWKKKHNVLKEKMGFTNKTCPICLNFIKKDNLTETICKHSFCESCLKNWRETNNSCPNCRTIINNNLIESFEMEEEDYVINDNDIEREITNLVIELSNIDTEMDWANYIEPIITDNWRNISPSSTTSIWSPVSSINSPLSSPHTSSIQNPSTSPHFRYSYE